MANESYLQAAIRDIEWFAVDEEGRLAFFTTGGRGAIPSSVVSSLHAMSDVHWFITNEFEELGEYEVSKGALSKAGIMQNDPSSVWAYLRDFAAMAKRGLYAYDAHLWPEGRTPYYRVAIPAVPRRLCDVSAHIATILERTRLTGVSFQEAEELEVSDFRDDLFPT